jgi:hypothetical protein
LDTILSQVSVQIVPFIGHDTGPGLSPDTGLQSQDLKPGRPKYVAAVFITQPLHGVSGNPQALTVFITVVRTSGTHCAAEEAGVSV